jgi:fructose-1,6-bisphosphatase/inositol monophosphatase family enzyme
MDQENYTELMAFAVALAQDAGKVTQRYFAMHDKSVEIKKDDSPVTAADKEINQMVIDAVQARYPEHGVLSEEGSANADRPKLWVCDPIDGTKGFILGIPTALFSIAFVVDGEALIGVMHDSFQSKTYAAVKGQDATVNGRLLQVSTRSSLTRVHFAGISSYGQIMERRAYFDSLAASGAKPLIVPGNVFRSALVADGFIDGHVFPGRSAHDIAAAKVIVEAAGGKVTDLNGEEQRYDGAIYGAIISNGRIHDELVEHMKTFGAENYVGY